MKFDPTHSALKTELENALEQILEDAIITHYDSLSGERFQECVICGEWDGHESTCPIPAIDKFVNSGAK